MSEVAAEVIELPDDEHVVLPQSAQAIVESRPVVAHAGGEVVIEVRLVDARVTQSVALLQELAAGPEDDDAAGRLRGPGAGRKALTEHDAGLVAALERLVDPATRGDPTGPLRWEALRNGPSSKRCARSAWDREQNRRKDADELVFASTRVRVSRWRKGASRPGRRAAGVPRRRPAGCSGWPEASTRRRAVCVGAPDPAETGRAAPRADLRLYPQANRLPRR